MAGLAVVVALSFSGIYFYYGYAGLPESIIFRRWARHYCIQCGSQALNRTTTLCDSLTLIATPPAVVQSPKIDGIDPSQCQHTFTIIGVREQVIEFRSLRQGILSYGNVDAEPFWSSPAMVAAFAQLSRSNVQDAGEIFSYMLSLRHKGTLRGELLETVTGTNIAEIIPALHKEYTKNGNVLLSERRRMRAH